MVLSETRLVDERLNTMPDWLDPATDVLRAAASQATSACIPKLHAATSNAINALLSEGAEVPADLRVYRMVIEELYGDLVKASESNGNH